MQSFGFGGVAVAHRRVSMRGVGGRAIRSDGFIPHSETSEDVRWHVQSVRYPWRERAITLGRGQSAFGERRVVVAMDEIMNNAGMVRVLLPQLFQDGRRFELLGQSCVIGRGVTNC